MKPRINALIVAACCSLFSLAFSALAQGTAFTYQGRLDDAGAPANGSYDLKFTLFATNSGGAPIANSVTNLATSVSSGLFTATLDFGPVFNGENNWLEIEVRTNGAASFSPPLAPRQPLTPVPYAVTAQSVTGPVGSNNLAGTYPNAVILDNSNNSFSGNGANLTSLDASQLTSGTVPDAQLSTNVALRAGGNAFTGNQTVTNGTVGIGTISPTASLEINTPSGRSLLMDGPGGATWSTYDTTTKSFLWDMFATSNNFAISRSGIDFSLFISYATGKVGINTNSPTSALEVNGTVTATHFSGDASGLTGLNASQITTGVIPAAQLPATVVTSNAIGLGIINGLLNNGANLTALNASELTSGTVPDARLSTNAALRAGGNAFTGNQTVTNGTVGIGTTSPSASLEINTPSGRSLLMDGPGGANWSTYDTTTKSFLWDIFGTSNNFAIGRSSIDFPFLVSYATGDVGIGLGTNSPQAQLDVGGPARFAGDIAIGTNSSHASVEINTPSGRSLLMDGPGGANWSTYDTTTKSFLWDIFATSNNFAIGRSGVDFPLFISYATGDVGIGLGANAPQAQLDVGGSAHFAGSVGIGTTTTASDSALQVNGLVRLGSGTGTAEAPNRSILVRRINSSADATNTVVARVSSSFTLERDGTPGGLLIRVAANSGAPVITGTAITSSGTSTNIYLPLFGGGVGVYQIITDAQQIGHFNLTFGDPVNTGDMTEVTLTRFIGGGNNTVQWVGFMTSTFDQ